MDFPLELQGVRDPSFDSQQGEKCGCADADVGYEESSELLIAFGLLVMRLYWMDEYA